MLWVVLLLVFGVLMVVFGQSVSDYVCIVVFDVVQVLGFFIWVMGCDVLDVLVDCVLLECSQGVIVEIVQGDLLVVGCLVLQLCIENVDVVLGWLQCQYVVVIGDYVVGICGDGGLVCIDVQVLWGQMLELIGYGMFDFVVFGVCLVVD